MKVLEIQEFGKLTVAERATPQPGPGEVVIRMHAWSLNYRDMLVVKGLYNPKMPLPMVPFSDGAGEVVETGENVTRVKPGDRVMPIFMQKWIAGEPDEAALRSALGGSIQGVAAEHVVLDAEGLVKIPDYLSYEEAATLPCAGVTAWHALVTEGNIGPGDTVLLQGSGGVSVFALQFAKMRGATVIASSSSEAKMGRLREMGADHVLNYRENPDWHKTAKEITGGRGVDQIVEVGGEGTLGKSMRAVRPGGFIHVIGVLAGRGQVDFTPVFVRNLRLQGIFVGSRDMFEVMCREMAANALKPVVDRVFGFREAEEALAYMESGAHFGKVVVAA